MTPREMVDRIDAGRLLTTTILQRCDLGLDPAATIRELAPNLSEVAVDTARKLVELTAFNFAATALVLAGFAPLENLADVPEPPVRAARRTPDEIAAEWLNGPAWTLGPEPEPSPDGGQP